MPAGSGPVAAIGEQCFQAAHRRRDFSAAVIHSANHRVLYGQRVGGSGIGRYVHYVPEFARLLCNCKPKADRFKRHHQFARTLPTQIAPNNKLQLAMTVPENQHDRFQRSWPEDRTA